MERGMIQTLCPQFSGINFLSAQSLYLKAVHHTIEEVTSRGGVKTEMESRAIRLLM